jgi:hypothetical protein
MKATSKNKIVNEEEKDEYIDLIQTNLSATFRTLQYLGRTTSVSGSAQGILLRELAEFVAGELLDAGQDPEEAEETLLKALEDVIDSSEEEEEEEEGNEQLPSISSPDSGFGRSVKNMMQPIITNPVPVKEVRPVGGLPGPGIDPRDGAAGGEDIGND